MMKALKVPAVSSGEVTTDLCFVNLLKHENEGLRNKLVYEAYQFNGYTVPYKPSEDELNTEASNAVFIHKIESLPISIHQLKRIPEQNLLSKSDKSVEAGKLLTDGITDYTTPLFNTPPEYCITTELNRTFGNVEDAGNQSNDLEDKLLNIQKMEAIGTLAGGIAHDFNNILMGIQGYISMILYELKPDHPQRVKFENIQNYLQMGADLTKQLLNFAQGEKHEVKATEINELLDKSASMFGRTKKEISIYKHLKDNLWTVDVDSSQINQVFLNLFINAAQAMPGGGNLTLETNNVLLNDSESKTLNIPEGRYIKIMVMDDGIGMDKKTLKRIFEPFFTTKPKGVGTGLGLSSVFGIIKNHGGAIDVKSEPGKGTSFRIYLPATNHKPVVGLECNDEIQTGTETILIVDDEKLNIAVMKEMLEMLNYRVLCAGSGQEALAVYMEKQHDIDIVILDMILPGMSGAQTFETLRRINPHVPVILASGYNARGDAQKILENGCNEFIQKPFHLQDLSKKIRTVLDSCDH